MLPDEVSHPTSPQSSPQSILLHNPICHIYTPMDTLTHAVSGALVYKAWTASRPSPKSRWAVPLAMLVAASPDVDIFFAPTPMDFLLLHRGITHALAAMPLMACLAALCMFPLWKSSTPQAWSCKQTGLLGLTLIALHVFLDCITTYGTMIFLPFSDYRVRLNGMFIVDLWLLIPMILACLAWPSGYANRPPAPPVHWQRGRRTLLWAACGWMLLYPVSTVVWRMQLEGLELIALVDKAPVQPSVMPDALSPLHWRILYATAGLTDPLQPCELPVPTPAPPAHGAANDAAKGAALGTPAPFPPQNTVHQQGLNGWDAPTTPVFNYPAANPDLIRLLAREDVGSAVFFNFTMLPLQYSQPWEGGIEYLFYDLRFNSLVPFVRSLMAVRSSGQVPFLLRARFDHQHTLVERRMTFSGSNRDSGWQPPQAPKPVTWARWLVGLR